jgi:branched-chain amino acid transport system substrate-binding protein
VRTRSALLAVAAAVAGLTGCGSAHRPGDRIRGKTLTIYFSGPLRGASSTGAQAALNGAQMALAAAQGRVGSYRIAFKPLDDSTVQSDGWDPNQTTLNARLAAQDPTTIGYLGEFNSGASAIAIPLLNRAGIPQISPGSSAVGLTAAAPGASPGEPQKYYPAGSRTFARVVPSDAIEAAALVHLQQKLGCHRVFVLQDGEVDGEDMALTFALTAKSARLRVLGVQVFQRQATDYSSLVTTVRQSGAGCLLISGIDERSAALVTEQIFRVLPSTTIFVSNGLADSAYTRPVLGGIPRSLDARVIIASATLDPSAYPASGQAFLAAYSRRFGPPEPPAIFGYEAMSLMLNAIGRATDQGRKPAERSKVVAAIVSTRDRQSVLGTYSIDSGGATTIRRYGIYRLAAGRLSFFRASG